MKAIERREENAAKQRRWREENAAKQRQWCENQRHEATTRWQTQMWHLQEEKLRQQPGATASHAQVEEYVNNSPRLQAQYEQEMRHWEEEHASRAEAAKAAEVRAADAQEVAEA